MRKPALTALGHRPSACFADRRRHRSSAPAPKVLAMQPGEIIALTSDNFHCQVRPRRRWPAAPTRSRTPVQVYFAPHQLAVVKFDKTGKKASLLAQVKR